MIQIDILLIQPFLPILWPKTVQMAINGPLVAISWPGGSEMADLRGSRLDQVRTHPGGCVGTISRVRNGHWGAHFRIFVFLHFCNFQQKNENFANLEIPLLLSRTTLLCVFSTGEPCKDRLILTAIPCRENPNSEHFFNRYFLLVLRFFCFCSTVQTFSKIFKSGQKKSPVCVCICICIIHKTRSICFSNITKKTKENDEKCLGSQIKKIEICIGDWLD